MFIASAWRGSSGCFAALFPLNDWEKCLTQRREGAEDKWFLTMMTMIAAVRRHESP
jgi:hypothetical protein